MATTKPHTEPAPSAPRTVADLLRERAAAAPDRMGYAYLADGDAAQVEVTYGALDRKARGIAAALRDTCPEGGRAVLLLPPGLDYVSAFFGCLYAGVVAVPVALPDGAQARRAVPQLLSIIGDARAGVALTTASTRALLDGVAQAAPVASALRWLVIDEPLPEPADDAAIAVDPDALAMLQYTSGSTATPRGVMLTHENLLHNLALIQRRFGTSSDTRALIWLPPYHDMGLIGGLLQPLYARCQVTLMSPRHFLEQPLRWLRAIDRLRITATGGPNFAYDLCARRATPEVVAQLDLGCWRVAFNGAEPIRPQTLDRFASVFAPAGFDRSAFLPCYGLAEATLIVTGAGGRHDGAPTVPLEVRVDRAALSRGVAEPTDDGSGVRLTGCGVGAADQQILIADPVTLHRREPGRIGEIWVSGPSVAAGYWRQPDLTAEVFGARLVGSDAGPFLRTGDLGFVLDGQLVVTGRRKDVLIVRGHNYYPHDIERTAEACHEAVRTGCSAAFQVDNDDGEPRLVVAVEVRRTAARVDVDELAVRLRHAVASDHGLQVDTVAVVRAGAVPKTSSGKVQRRLCRAHFLAGRLAEIGRHDAAPDAEPAVDATQVRAAPPARRPAAFERYLRAHVGALVGQAPGALERDAALLAAGLDSLTVVQLQHQLVADFGIDLSVTALLDGATLAQVADHLHAQLDGSGATAPPTEPGGRVRLTGTAPLTGGARWMWLLQQLEPESTMFTVAVALRLPEGVHRDALARALDTVTARHDALRTTFEVRDGEPVQVVHARGGPVLREHDVPDRDARTIVPLLQAAADEPFDLAAGPLLRADLFRHADGTALVLAMHHIAVDFWSGAILARELGALYTAYAAGQDLQLPPPRATSVDVARWRRTMADDPERGPRLARYWSQQLHGAPAGPVLPRSGRRQGDRGGAVAFSLPAELSARLRTSAATEDTTLYVLLLAAFETLLHGVTGRPDLVVGATMSGRTRPEFADVVGCCITTAVIRSRADAAEPFRSLLRRTREQIRDALEHQDYPVAVLGGGDARRGAGVDVLFTLNRAPAHGDDLLALATMGTPGERRALDSLPVEAIQLELEEGALPLEVMMAEVGGVLHGLVRHRADVLDGPAARRLVESYAALLACVADDPAVALADLTAHAADVGRSTGSRQARTVVTRC